MACEPAIRVMMQWAESDASLVALVSAWRIERWRDPNQPRIAYSTRGNVPRYIQRTSRFAFFRAEGDEYVSDAYKARMTQRG